MCYELPGADSRVYPVQSLAAGQATGYTVHGWIYLVIVTVVSGLRLFHGLVCQWRMGCPYELYVLAVLWIGCTIYAGYAAVRRRFFLHGAFMIRSYALTLSAITLRLYTYLLDLTT